MKSEKQQRSKADGTRVYYLTAAQYALSNIALRRIKIARFEDLNDPFELLGAHLGQSQFRPALRAIRKEINARRGLVCFSRAWRNPLLWGHYADKHTGICLGFDVPDRDLAPVIYAKSLLRIDADEKGAPVLSEKVINKLQRTKYFDWRYEREMRLFVELDGKPLESGNYFLPFSFRLKLREVILGPKCELDIGAVRTLVASFHPNVEVVKARIAFTMFRVFADRTASKHTGPYRWGQYPMANRPWLSSLVLLGIYANSAVESGLGNDFSFRDVHTSIQRGTLFDDLEHRFKGKFDLSIFRADAEQRAGALEALSIAAGHVLGRERRKLAVEKNGLSLLLALILEIVQQGYWVKPHTYL